MYLFDEYFNKYNYIANEVIKTHCNNFISGKVPQTPSPYGHPLHTLPYSSLQDPHVCPTPSGSWASGSTPVESSAVNSYVI
jgi:hypothetical protein